MTKKEIVPYIVDQILKDRKIEDIRTEVRKANNLNWGIVNKYILAAQEVIHEQVDELKSILPDLNLYRLNQLYIDSENKLDHKKRAEIVKLMNECLGVYKETIDLNMNYTFELDQEDNLKPVLPETDKAVRKILDNAEEEGGEEEDQR